MPEVLTQAVKLKKYGSAPREEIMQKLGKDNNSEALDESVESIPPRRSRKQLWKTTLLKNLKKQKRMLCRKNRTTSFSLVKITSQLAFVAGFDAGSNAAFERASYSSSHREKSRKSVGNFHSILDDWERHDFTAVGSTPTAADERGGNSAGQVRRQGQR